MGKDRQSKPMKHSPSLERSPMSPTVNGAGDLLTGRGGDGHPSPSRAGSSGTRRAPLLPSSPKTCPPDTPTLPSEGSCPVDPGSPSSTQRPVATLSENVGSRWTLQGPASLGARLCPGTVLDRARPGLPGLPSLPGSNACP